MGRDFQDGVLSSRLINKWHFNWAFVLSGHQMVHECWLSGFFFPIPSSCRIFSNFRRQVLTPWISEENLVEFQWRKADWTWTNSSTGCFCANWPSNHWNEPTRFIQIKWTNKFISNMSSFPSIFGRNSETRRQWNAPSDWASSAPATAVTIYPTFYSSSHDLQSSRSTLSINMKSPTEFHLFVGREWDDRRLRLWPPSERGQRRHFWDSLALREETTFSLIGWIFNHSTGPCDTHTWTYKAKIIDNQTIASINRTFRQSKSPEMSTIRNGFWYRKMIIIYHYL